MNIILDYLFIGFFHLGASGAALGTTLSQACSVLFALIAIKRKQTGLSLSCLLLRRIVRHIPIGHPQFRRLAFQELHGFRVVKTLGLDIPVYPFGFPPAERGGR